MPPQRLAELVRRKYPGQYDDMDDDSLEKAILTKYPDYKDLVKVPETTAPSKSTVTASGRPTFGSRVSDFAGSMLEFGKNALNATYGGNPLATAEMGRSMAKPVTDVYTNPHNRNVPNRLADMVGGLAGFDTEAIREDFGSGNYGALAGDVLPQIGLGLLGARGARAKPAPKPPITVDPLAGAQSRLTNPQRLLPPANYGPATGDISPARFTGTPEGNIILGTDPVLPGMVQASKVVNKQPPHTRHSIRDYPETGNLPERLFDAWDWDAFDAMRAPEPYNPPRSQGIGSRDYLTEQGNIFSTVPNRLRPEAPNVTALRNLSQGAPKALSGREPRGLERTNQYPGQNWGAEPVTIELVGDVPQVVQPTPKITSGRIKKVSGEIVKEKKGTLKAEKAQERAGKAEAASQPKAPEIEPLDLSEKPELGYFSNRKFMESVPEFKNIMDTYIKERQSGKQLGAKIRDKFQSALGHLVPTDLPAFQKALGEGKFSEVKAFFEDRFNKMKEAGVEMGRKENYLPQIWENNFKEVKAKLGDKYLSQRAPFTYESVIKDYEAGVAAGLKPKMSPLELVDWYEQRSNQLLADRKFTKAAADKGYITQKIDSEVLREIIDPNHMPGNWRASPQVKGVVENYLKTEEGLGSALATLSGKATSVALSSGIPKIPLGTAHGLNMARAAFAEGGFKRLGQAIKFGLKPSKATEFMVKNRDNAISAVRNDGLTLHVENPATQISKVFEGETGFAKGTVNKIVELQSKYFEKPLFEQMIPSLKLQAFGELKAKLVKDGLAPEVAGKQAAESINNFYSGINYDLLYRNKRFQNTARSLLLAPDWLESRMRRGKGTFTDATANNKYQKAAGRTLAAYAALNIAQKMITGKFMVENEKGHEFDLDAGDSEEKKRWLRVFGTEEDFFRIPAQVLMDIGGEGSLERLVKAGRGKMSIPAGFGFDMFTGKDYQGNPLITGKKGVFGQDVSLGERAVNTAADAANFLPQGVKSGVELGLGKHNLEQAILGTIESPFVYSYKKKGKDLFPSPRKPKFGY